MSTSQAHFWTALNQSFPFIQAAPLPPVQSHDESVRQLYQNLKEKYPLATEKYWLPRTWQMWTWQPIYLCLCAYYTLKQPLDATKFEVFVSGIFTSGFYTDTSSDCFSSSFDMMQMSLQQYIQQQIALFDHVFEGRFSHKLANQYTMDSILGCLILLLNKKIVTSVCIADSWTSLLSVPKVSQISINQDSGEYYLRPSLCCQHFRINKDNLCPGCPRLKKHPAE